MRAHLAIVFGLIVCGPAMAEAAQVTPAPSAVATMPPDQATQLSLPYSTGPRHTCPLGRWQSAMQAGQSGMATLAFQIDKGGKPANVTVKTSSGYPALDDAAIACASDWRYVPATLNGSPAEALWAAGVDFTADVFRRAPTEARHVDPSVTFCPGYPESKLPNLKPTVVLIKIGADGSITDSSIVQSSGDASLDQFTLTCTSTARFKHDIASAQQTAGKLLFPIFWPRKTN